eukprot:7664892-Pyramimonas_sp.AAC.1
MQGDPRAPAQDRCQEAHVALFSARVDGPARSRRHAGPRFARVKKQCNVIACCPRMVQMLP